MYEIKNSQYSMSSSNMSSQQNTDVERLQDKMNALLSKYSQEYLLYFNNTLRPAVMGGTKDDYRGQVIEIAICDIKCPRDAKIIDRNGKCRCVDAHMMRDCTCDDVSSPDTECGGCATGCRSSRCKNLKTGRWGTRNDCRCNIDNVQCGCPAPGTGFYARECKLPSEWRCRNPRRVQFYVDEERVLHKIVGKCARTPIKIKGTLSQLRAGGKYTLGSPLSDDATCYPQVNQSTQLSKLEKELMQIASETDNKIQHLQQQQRGDQVKTIKNIHENASALSKYRTIFNKIKAFQQENRSMHTMISELTLRVTSAKTRYIIWVLGMFILLFITWRHLTNSPSL
jgi:hypothetical protein